MKLPESLTKVTTLSKTLALVLFIVLPFSGFHFGRVYQKSVTPIEIKEFTIATSVTPTPSLTTTQSPSTESIVINEKIDKDWQKFTFKNDPVFKQDELNGYVEHGTLATFSLQIPEVWKQTANGDRYFENNEGKKQLEFNPGVIAKETIKSCKWDFEDDKSPAIISRSSKTIGKYKTEITIRKSTPDGLNIKEWYPNIYCVDMGEKAFQLTFYEYELGKGDKKMFEKVIASIKI
jgi:hypothetical protein